MLDKVGPHVGGVALHAHVGDAPEPWIVLSEDRGGAADAAGGSYRWVQVYTRLMTAGGNAESPAILTRNDGAPYLDNTHRRPSGLPRGRCRDRGITRSIYPNDRCHATPDQPLRA